MTVVAHSHAADAAPYYQNDESDPRQPFGDTAHPLPNMDLPITERGLQLAHELMVAHFGVSAEDMEKGEPGIALQLIKAYELAKDRSRWTIHADYVQIVGSKGEVYKTKPDFCEGPRWLNPATRKPTTACRGEIKSGIRMCYHQLAAEYLRLAQQLDGAVVALTDTDDAGEGPTLMEIASVEVEGRDFFGMIAYLCLTANVEEDSLDLLFSGSDENIVTVTCGQRSVIGPARVDGGALISVTPQALADLWAILRVKGKNTPLLQLGIYVDEVTCEGVMTVCGEGIDAGIDITGAPYGHGQPTTNVPEAINPVLAA